MSTSLIALAGAVLVFAANTTSTSSGNAHRDDIRVRAEVSPKSAVVGARPEIYLVFENVGDAAVDVPLPHLYSITCWAPPCVVGDIFLVSEDQSELTEMGYLDRSHKCILSKEQEVERFARLFPGESIRVHLNARAKRFPGPGGSFAAAGRYRLVARYVYEPSTQPKTCPRLARRAPITGDNVWRGSVSIEPLEFTVRPQGTREPEDAQ